MKINASIPEKKKKWKKSTIKIHDVKFQYGFALWVTGNPNGFA